MHVEDGTSPDEFVGEPYVLPNVWLGVSVESNQYVWRADYLRKAEAAVRWVSAEPLLGFLPQLNLDNIDWLVAGGESGINARPTHPDWFRQLRNSTQQTGTPFFFKQWGRHHPVDDYIRGDLTVSSDPGHLMGYTDWCELKSHSDNIQIMRPSRKQNVTQLDGKEWGQYPNTQQRHQLLDT